jgi:hypothetical protein
VGLPADPRRADHHGHGDHPLERLVNPEAPRHRAVTAENGADLGSVPHCTGERTDGCDFFLVDTVLLRRLYVLVFIHDETRFVRIAGVSANPVAEWVAQQARNLSMELTDQATALKFLIRDRDTKFTASFDAVSAAEGIKIISAPSGHREPTPSVNG